MGQPAETNKLGNIVAMPMDSFISEGVLDIAFSADDLHILNTAFWIDGVIPFERSGDYSADTSAKVTALNGFNIQIAPGRVHVDGTVCFWNNALLGDEFAVESPDSQDRIDAVIVRRDMTGRKADILIIKGTPDADPVAPAINYDSSGLAEFRLADIYVRAGIAQLSNSDITDRRAFIRARLGVDEELAKFQAQLNIVTAKAASLETGKADVDFRNTEMSAYIIDYWRSSDGLSTWEKYSNGKMVQTGVFTNTSANHAIKFLKNFIRPPHYTSACIKETNADATALSSMIGCNNVTVSGMVVRSISAQGTAVAGVKCWKAEGYWRL